MEIFDPCKGISFWQKFLKMQI